MYDAVSAGGITPACAGKRILGHNAKRIRQDHPRVCGEKYLKNGNIKIHRDHPRVCGEKCRAAKDFCAVRGSPPRVRGKVHQKK